MGGLYRSRTAAGRALSDPGLLTGRLSAPVRLLGQSIVLVKASLEHRAHYVIAATRWLSVC